MEVQEERKPKNLFTKTIVYYRKNGMKKCLKKIYMKFFRMEEVSFQQWQKGFLPTKEELEKQRQATFSHMPLISVVVPLYRTPEKYFKAMAESVIAQTYGNWELCLADGSGGDDDAAQSLEALAKRYCREDSRIRYQKLEKNLGISDNTNAAITMSTGAYIALLDHDDMLSPDALFECVKAVNAHEKAEVLYSDEDKVDMKGKKYYEPHFKSDFNETLLCTMNYICHLFVVKRELLDKVGGFDRAFDGAQDYDFIFRCTEEAKEICHIQKLLYHWRCHENSTARNPESKRYAFEAGKRAVEAHYKRLGIDAKVSHGIKYGMYRTEFSRGSNPLVSVIIPNKDHGEDLKLCVTSLLDKTAYKNLEIIVVENGSTKKATFDCYRELKDLCPGFQVVTWDKGFNYSAINNFGAGFAKGEYLLLLNNDLEFINDCVTEMLSYGMRPEVGVVGARLYYGDDTVQHAGVFLGIGGIAGHGFVGLPRSEYGYMARAVSTQEVSGVTAACMMVRKSVFDEVGGLTEELAVAFNDVDFCMKVRKAGLKVIFDAEAEGYHYESKSRGLEDTPEKLERFHREMRLFKERWQKELEAGDPFYNQNLTLERNDFSCKSPRWIPREF